MERPYRFNKPQLAKVGVEFLEETEDGKQYGNGLRCKVCGMGWHICYLSGGRRPKNYWKCPNGCNDENSPFSQIRNKNTDE